MSEPTKEEEEIDEKDNPENPEQEVIYSSSDNIKSNL